MAGTRSDDWTHLWRYLAALQSAAARLRALSQREPLVQRRPDYPHAGLDRSHAEEVRRVLEEVQHHLGAVRSTVPAVLPSTAPPGIAADEQRDELVARAGALSQLASALAEEAFRPLPTLPPHSPSYLVAPPGHDLAGTKAVLLAIGLETLTASVRNLILAAANTESP